MGAPYECHVFVCTNRRPDGHPRGSCAAKGSEPLRDRLKSEVGKRGLAGKIRVNAAGCLDTCEEGISIVVYPEATWYGRVTEADVPELVDEHLVGKAPVERLKMNFDALPKKG